MDSCRKASKASTTERLWTYSRNPQRRDIRKSNTNPWTVHRFTEESLWTDASYNPSWVHDMSRLEKAENRCALKAQGANHHDNKNSGGWEMLSLEEALSSLREGMSPLQPSVEDFACILHMCRKERNKAHALHLHAYICKSGLEVHPSLGNHLFLMLVEVGCMSHAQEVFDRLVCRDECSWNSLIIGYVKCGELQLALTLYHKMQEEVSLHPSGQAFVALLKACTALKDLERGHEIHADIARKGLLESNVFVGSTLVDMYAKCGSLAKAQEVFDNLSVRNVVSWNVLITGYAEHGHGHEALAYFEQMQQRKDLSPDAVTYVCSLKACGTIGATLKGREIHAEIERKGSLEGDIFLGSTLVDMYAKCGTLTEAQAVFDKIPDQNVVSWNALIAGYVEHGHGKEALNCFEQMQLEGISPSAVTFVCSLKACCSIQAIGKGQEIHAEIAKKGLLERDVVLGSTLVDMYAKSGSLAKAQDVFDKLLVRNVVSWNALMAGYVEHGHCEEALTCFEQMQQEGISPDAVTLICSLKACSSMGTTVKGREIHTEIVRKGLEGDLFLGSTLVDMYAKCGSLAKAQEVFDKLRAQNVVSWTALIAGYAEHGCGEEALWCFEQMQQEGVSPGAVTFVCSLKACGSIVATVKGQEIHAEIAKKGMERDDAVGSTLVDMYVKCGLLVEAHVVFENLPFQEVFSWTALMTGFVECRRGEEALNCFEQMKHMGIFPDAVTFVCSLKACGSIGATVKGREIHAEIAKKGLEKELLVGNTLVDMYAKCGLLATAQEVFDKLPIRDVVSWNALITRYVEFGHGGEALNCFEQMQHEGISPDAVALVCSLIACGSIGAIVKGQEIHAEITRRGLERELLVGNTLVDLYAKCGSFATAQYVFDKLRVRSMVSWNALMVGYAQLGESENVFQIFHGMTGEGTEPDLVTFLSILSACNHAGLVDKGQMYFEAIINDYDLIPTLEHYNCMVDLLGRAGHIDKAVAMIKNMPFHPGIVVWQTVLGACRKWGDVELGRHAFEHVVCFDEKDAAAYVCMYNIYVDAVMHEEANKVEALRVEKQAWKKQAQNLWMDTCPRDCGFLFGWG